MNDKNNEKETSEYYMNCHHRKDIFGKLVGNNDRLPQGLLDFSPRGSKFKI
jgi:hypothetical protein